MHFQFSNSSCDVLIKSLSNIREEREASKRMDLKIGESLNEVDFHLIMDLINISNNRINLDLTEVDMLSIIKKSESTLKELTTKMNESDENKKDYLLQRVAKLGQCSIVEEIFKIDGLYLDFKPTLLEIAQEK